MFVCVPERVKLKEAQEKNKTKQKNNDDGNNNWLGGPTRGFICLDILDAPDNEKNGHKRLSYLVLYNNFLGNAGGKCVAKKEDNCFDIKVVTHS